MALLETSLTTTSEEMQHPAVQVEKEKPAKLKSPKSSSSAAVFSAKTNHNLSQVVVHGLSAATGCKSVSSSSLASSWANSCVRYHKPISISFLTVGAIMLMTLSVLYWNYYENIHRKMTKKHGVVLDHWGKGTWRALIFLLSATLATLAMRVCY